MPHSISGPAPGGSGFKVAEHEGELIVFVGCTLEVDVVTQYETSNAARVEIVVPLDGDGAGEVYYDALIFNKVLVPSLTNAQSPIVVGRLGTGEAKGSQNAPFLLTDPSEEEHDSVVKWLADNVGSDKSGSYIIIADEKPFT